MNAFAADSVKPYGTAELEYQLSLLAQVASALARDSDARQMRGHALRAAVAGTHAQRGVVLLFDRSADVFWGTAPAIGWSDEEALGLSMAAGECAVVDAVHSGALPMYAYPGASGERIPSFFVRANAKNGCIVPLWSGKDIAGVMCLLDKTEAAGRFLDVDAAFVKTVLMQLSTGLRSARLRDYGARRGVAKTAALFAGGDFDDVLSMEVDRAERLSHSLGCAVLEIEDFATALKELGPAAIDTAIKCVAQTIRENMRQTDILLRYDEATIALLMPGTNVAGAQIVASRLAERLHSIEVPRAGRVHVRCGVSAYPVEARSGSDLVAIAVKRARE